jgi:hypothetical protein
MMISRNQQFGRKYMIYSFRNEQPNLIKILVVMNSDADLPYLSRTTMHRTLKDLKQLCLQDR